MEEEFSYRKYINSDFSSYCDLFDNVYSHKINSEFFNWKHNLSGSIKEPFIYLVFNKTGNLIGANSFFKSEFKLKNKIYNAIQSGDTMVHLDYRGKGIFKKIIKFAMADLKNYGFDFIFGFANNNSYPGFIKLGFKSMYKVNNYIKILNYKLIFQNKLSRIPFGSLMGGSLDNLKKVTTFNSKYSVSMTKNITNEMASFICSTMSINLGQIKDKALLNWKYVNNPNSNYEILIIKNDSIIEGIFIVRIEKDAMKSVTVMEYFIKNNEDTNKILKAVIQYYRIENMGYLRSWELGSSVYKDALAKNYLIKKNLEIYFIVKLINETATEVLDLNFWHIVNGDADTV